MKLYPSECKEPYDPIDGLVIVDDGRNYNYDGSFWYENEYVLVLFDIDGKMNLINVTSKKYATDKDLKVGDSKKKVISTYGDNYKTNSSKNTYYYEQDDIYLAFIFEGDTIEWWSLTRNLHN